MIELWANQLGINRCELKEYENQTREVYFSQNIISEERGYFCTN